MAPSRRESPGVSEFGHGTEHRPRLPIGLAAVQAITPPAGRADDASFAGTAQRGVAMMSKAGTAKLAVMLQASSRWSPPRW